MNNDEVVNYQDQLIRSVCECIQFKSVRDLNSSSLNAPFGTGIQNCLEWILRLGDKLGFRTKNIDGYVGHIEMGEGPLLGILGHIDVVPEGDGWSVDPYKGIISNGKIFGRGALDDKGPLLASLYAMKAILDSGQPLKRTVRLIVGTDEESGWADMTYYKKIEEIPVEGFSPDAQFPLINAEKGTIHIEITKHLPKLPHIFSIIGGVRANVVPDLCTIDLQNISTENIAKVISRLQSENEINISHETLANTTDGCFQIIKVKGISSHGSTPEMGKNAVVVAMNILSLFELTDDEKKLIDWVSTYPANGVNGEGFGIEACDQPSGKLTTNIGVFELKDNLLKIIIDLRFPVTIDKTEIFSPIEKIVNEYGFEMKILAEHAPHYVPKDNALVQSLLNAYSNVTGLEPYTIGIGGGTYAKLLPQGVAFGPCLPGEPEHIHCPDEYISIENLILASRVYTQAIINLAT